MSDAAARRRQARQRRILENSESRMKFVLGYAEQIEKSDDDPTMETGKPQLVPEEAQPALSEPPAPSAQPEQAQPVPSAHQSHEEIKPKLEFDDQVVRPARPKTAVRRTERPSRGDSTESVPRLMFDDDEVPAIPTKIVDSAAPSRPPYLALGAAGVLVRVLLAAGYSWVVLDNVLLMFCVVVSALHFSGRANLFSQPPNSLVNIVLQMSGINPTVSARFLKMQQIGKNVFEYFALYFFCFLVCNVVLGFF